MKRKIFSAFMAVVMTSALLIASGCGDSDGSVKRVKKAGSLRVGYASCGNTLLDMPYSSADGGIIADMAGDIAANMRVNSELVPVGAGEAYDRLLDGSVDCLWNVCTPAKSYVSSVRTISTDIYCRQVVLTVSQSDIVSLADVNGKKMAVVSGSDAAEAMDAASVMKKSLNALISFDNISDLAQALLSGEVDCAAVGDPQAMYLQMLYPNDVKSTGSIISESKLVIAFRAEDSELCERVAKQYVKMMKNGDVDKLWRKYAGGSSPVQNSNGSTNA